MKLIIDIDEEVYKDAMNGISNGLCKYSNEAIINGVPYNPSGDAISRKALLADFKERNIWGKDIVEAINNAQAVEVRPKGEWETVRFSPDELNTPEKSKFDFVKCPFCEIIHQGRHNFCSHCGADMREE